VTDSNHKFSKEFYNTFWKNESSNQGLKVEAACRHNSVIASIQRLKLKKKPKIMDLGCGTGDLTIRLPECGSITGIDISDEAIRIARMRYPHINFVASSFFDVEIKKNSCDLIVSSEVIEHLTQDDQGKYIELIYQSLAEDAYLILTTPNKKVAQALGREGNQPIENWLDIDELTKLLTNHFRVLKVYTTYFEPLMYKIRNYSWLYFHLIEPIFRRTKGGMYTVILALKRKRKQAL